MGRSGTSKPDSSGSLQQEKMAVEWGCVEKRDVKSQTFSSTLEVIIYHKLEEEVNNVDNNGTANAAINGCAIEEEIFELCGKTSGTLPIIQDIHIPSVWAE
ncbi:hypothetical protein Q3G72_009163 [Acer saccharum]|nr:hypothetical protein Q3G72_009163 [Acer saccharum]